MKQESDFIKKKPSDKGSIKGFFLIVFLIVVLDQLTKRFCSFLLNYAEMVPLTSFFNLYLLHNPGIAFSFFDGGAETTRIVLTSFSFIFALVASIYLFQLKSRYEKLAFSFLIAGAIGNGIDRLIYGYVVDFLDFHLYGWHWPTFNLADSAVSIGAFLFIVCQLKAKYRSSSKAS